MKAIYADLHIHTSNDSNKLNDQYDTEKLITKIKEYAKSENILISLTDHNRINKEAYLKLCGKIVFLVGVELHIRNIDDCDLYHCHFYFDLTAKDLSNEIDKLNEILIKLYPNSMPSNNDKYTLVDSLD